MCEETALSKESTHWGVKAEFGAFAEGARRGMMPKEAKGGREKRNEKAEKTKRDKAMGSPAPPPQPHLPAVRAEYGVNGRGQKIGL